VQVVLGVLTAEVIHRDVEKRLRQEVDALGRDTGEWAASRQVVCA